MDTHYRHKTWTEEAVADARRRGQWPPREHVLEWLQQQGMSADDAVSELRRGLDPTQVQPLHRWFAAAHPELAALVSKDAGATT